MPYNANLYNPAYYNQPYQQMVPQMPQTPQMDNSILWVNGEKDALAFALAPNKAVALWDATAPVIYLKQSDASGRPSMKTFDLIERTEEISEKTQFAEKAAVDDALSKIIQSVSEVRSDIDRLDKAVYGLSGKPKKGKTEDET